MLKDFRFELIYNSSSHDIANDFIKPALENSSLYKRGVGYFTSGWLTYNAKGLAKFIENGGKVQFITSPILDQNDIEALSGQFDSSKIDKVILKNIDVLEQKLQSDTRNLLGWLVYDEVLEFKFAVLKNHLSGGEFHDKFGIFIDKNDNYVAFNGSMNDSIKGHYNYESIYIFKSWGDETSRLNAYETLKRFELLWNNQDLNIEVFTMSDIVQKKLIQLKKYSQRPYTIYKSHRLKDSTFNYSNKPIFPSWLKLRSYQKDAINTWIKNNGHGILAMATGSGKTLTALSATTHIIHQIDQKVGAIPLLVVVPYLHLVEQWAEEGKHFNIHFIKCNSEYKGWEKELNHAITSAMFDKSFFIPILTTIGTYKTDRFQKLVNKLENILLIVDEVHNFGTSSIQQRYLENTIFRLGLSATPKRYMDEDGTKKIFDYFGDIVFSYDLKDAIKDGNLTPYYYYPIFISLTEEEEEEYFRLSEKISYLVGIGHDIEDPDSSLKTLLIKRSKIIATASRKIVALEKLLKDENLIQSKRNLFYVAAHIERQDDEEIRMVDKVVILLRDLGMQVDKFTSDENKYERDYLIRKLSEGVINGLVAIRCLDEGVDIPSVERAFILASSSNPKEFVQRRGRVLRKSKTTDKRYAYIYDFIVLPNLSQIHLTNAMIRFERSYIEKELIRFQEFASLAENAHEIEPKILTTKQYYRLLHI